MYKVDPDWSPPEIILSARSQQTTKYNHTSIEWTQSISHMLASNVGFRPFWDPLRPIWDWPESDIGHQHIYHMQYRFMYSLPRFFFICSRYKYDCFCFLTVANRYRLFELLIVHTPYRRTYFWVYSISNHGNAID